ncbi:hypothetical protein RJ639_036806 [Escallonia herrerae]|uniref:Uncharacterized protein n=1 Tax=Escallonia herrerae TaxID=1293975 RepID=A0AA89BD72_9ASTE|nr:hypothetical protein RJ639_036806 [Escallonia herrerae]
MAMQTETPPTAPSAEVVGNAFVEQYYHILHQSPDSVYKFYQDSSVLSRPDADGVMTTVTTMKGINDTICSLDYTNYKAEIKTADAQDSYKDGVTVLVTGCLTGKDNLRRKFAQSFFLAPQDKGYFVLNDVFRYVEGCEPVETSKATNYEINDTPSVTAPSLTPHPEPSYVPDPPVTDPATSHIEENKKIDETTHEPLDDDSQLASEKVTMDREPHSDENRVSAVTEPASPSAQEGTPKKSYASIVSSQTKKGNAGSIKIYVPANTSKVAPTKTEKQSQAPAPEASVTSAPSVIDAPESSNFQDEGEGHSIYIRNLPLNATVAQLEVEFKKFGPIKQGGVQVRSSKQQGFCFGFVEFEDVSSMHSAIQGEEGCQMDESGTSNSSVVNADSRSSNAGDEDSCSMRAGDAFAFDFGILRVGSGQKEGENRICDAAAVSGGRRRWKWCLEKPFPVPSHSCFQASPVTIGNCQAAVEIKRTTTRVGSGRGRFPSGRGGFRNDSFRGRGTFNGSRSFGRNDFVSRGDFSDRGRGPGGRSGEAYQQGRGRGSRQGDPSQNAGSG